MGMFTCVSSDPEAGKKGPRLLKYFLKQESQLLQKRCKSLFPVSATHRDYH